MNKTETRQHIIDNIKWSYEKPSGAGGQQVNNFQRNGVILESEDLELVIKINYYKNPVDNRKLLLRIFESVIDDILK